MKRYNYKIKISGYSSIDKCEKLVKELKKIIQIEERFSNELSDDLLDYTLNILDSNISTLTCFIEKNDYSKIDEIITSLDALVLNDKKLIKFV